MQVQIKQWPLVGGERWSNWGVLPVVVVVVVVRYYYYYCYAIVSTFIIFLVLGSVAPPARHAEPLPAIITAGK